RTAGHLTTVRKNVSAGGSNITKLVRIDAFEADAATPATSVSDIVMLIDERHALGLAYVAFGFVHDYLSPRVRHLHGSVTQMHKNHASQGTIESWELIEREFKQVLDGISLFREEFRQYWRPSAAEGAVVKQCLEVAWANA